MQFKKYIVRVFLGVVLILFVSPVCIELQMQFHKFIVAKNLHQTVGHKSFTFSNEEFSRIEKVNAHEYKINGKMFDVASIQHNKQQVTLVGQFDSFEDELISEFVNFFHKGPIKNQSNIALFHFLFYEERAIELPMPKLAIEITPEANSKYLNVFSNLIGENDAPPPRNLSL